MMLRLASLSPFPPFYRLDNSADWTLYTLAAMNGKIGYLNEALSVYRYHPGGFWTSAPKETQEARVVEYYENIATVLPPAYAGLVNSKLVPRCYRLAMAYRRNGELELSERYLRKCESLEPDQRKLKWELRCATGNRARAVFPPDSLTIRIEPQTVSAGNPWDIQINEANLTAEAGREYALRFRARADEAREFFVGFSRAHTPWTGLGLYAKHDATPDWSEFEERFICQENDDNARIHFDLGGGAAALEVANIRLEPF